MALCNLLGEIQKSQVTNTDTTKGVFLFSSFIRTGDYLKRRLNACDYKVNQISGQTSSANIQKQVDEFTQNSKKNSDKVTILICSDAFKEGKNFQFCQHLIHYDFPYTPAAIGQRNGRIYRTGQQGKPKVYYMTVEESYDQRLFGEIIVNKAHIITLLSGEKKISVLNVLPNDGEEFLKNSLAMYFNDQVEQRQGNSLDDKAKREFCFQMKKKLQIMDKISDDDLIEKLKSYLKPYIEELSLGSEENFRNAFISIFSKENQDKSLLDVYQKSYENQLEAIHELFFGTKGDEGDFIENCKNYLSQKNIAGQSFCHNMMQEGSTLTLEEYKKQFKPLCMI